MHVIDGKIFDVSKELPPVNTKGVVINLKPKVFALGFFVCVNQAISRKN